MWVKPRITVADLTELVEQADDNGSPWSKVNSIIMKCQHTLIEADLVAGDGHVMGTNYVEVVEEPAVEAECVEIIFLRSLFNYQMFALEHLRLAKLTLRLTDLERLIVHLSAQLKTLAFEDVTILEPVGTASHIVIKNW
jgi:hypothetical protein